MEVRWQGHVLPYRVSDKDQRVSPATIVENKRLRHALSVIKAQLDRRQVRQDYDQQREDRIQEAFPGTL